jgi:hypothetical protein
MRNRSVCFHIAFLLLTLLVLLGVACERDTEANANALTPTAAASSVTASPSAAAAGAKLPDNSEIVSKIEVDVNGDEVAEQLVAFRAPSGGGLAIGDWTAVFPQGRQVQEVQVRYMSNQKTPEILAFVQGENVLEHYLYLYVWRDGAFAALNPVGGPYDGQDAFRSDYLRPLAEDGDSSGTEEVILCKIASNPGYLEIVFYEWDTGAFRYTTRFFAIPLHIPPEALTPTMMPKGD